LAELLSEIIYGFIGAVIAILVRDFFGWKSQGRMEAIKRYEKLLTECYGQLLPLIISLQPSDNIVFIINYDKIYSIYSRFSFRIPDFIARKIFDLLINVDDEKAYIFKDGDHAIDFLHGLSEDIQHLIIDLSKEIEKLEAYSQSIWNRLKYILLAWNFTNQNLLKGRQPTLSGKNTFYDIMD